MMGLVFWCIVSFTSCLVSTVSAHGRLIEPPSRGTMWRYGFSTPPDYNDHELYCGGYTRQWTTNAGKCGICGDPWDAATPRAHEAGGQYGRGVIVRRYKRNSSITIRVELTANHMGYFEFRLCPNNNPASIASQSCLDRHILAQVKQRDAHAQTTRYYPGPGNKIFETRYQLPLDLTCSQCVLQWRYTAGNNWGTCANGTGAVGCGPQEEFRACADVAIVDTTGAADETPYDNEIPTDEIEQIVGEAERMEYWLLAVIVVLSLVVVLAAMALFYFYYYHALGERVKKWLSVERFRKQSQTAPVAPPRTKKLPC